MPASTQTAFNCAPFMSSVDRANSSKLFQYEQLLKSLAEAAHLTPWWLSFRA